MPKGKGGAGPAGKTPAAELEKLIRNLGLSQAQVAKDVGLSVMTLKKLLDGKAKVDIERALVFAKYFGTSPDFWIELQKKAGLAEAKVNTKLQKQLKDLKKAKTVAAERLASAVGRKGPKPGAKAGGKKVATARKTTRKPRATSSPASTPSTSGYSF